jgi:ABC-type dipeptide/oligopeptide/nickel transport system permease component
MIFAWPGMGRIIVDAIFMRDYPARHGDDASSSP